MADSQATLYAEFEIEAAALSTFVQRSGKHPGALASFGELVIIARTLGSDGLAVARAAEAAKLAWEQVAVAVVDAHSTAIDAL